ALLQAINHSLVKSLLFCTTGNILIKYESRDLNKVKGMLQVLPATGILLMAGALALVGTPPFNIFLSKFLIVTTGLGGGHVWLVIAALLFLMVVFAAFFRVIASAVFGEKPAEVVKGEANWLTLAPALVLVLLALMMGLYIPSQLMTLLNGASGVVLSGAPQAGLAWLDARDILMSFSQLVP
ncbi:MAG: proton-conducting transporter membrane subunit, partial [Bacteroidota bacterium]